MLHDVLAAIRDHAVPDNELRWRSRPLGYFGRWGISEVTVGALADGRWYMRHVEHVISGPLHAAFYASEAEVTAAARAVMAAAEPDLIVAGYRPPLRQVAATVRRQWVSLPAPQRRSVFVRSPCHCASRTARWAPHRGTGQSAAPVRRGRLRAGARPCRWSPGAPSV